MTDQLFGRELVLRLGERRIASRSVDGVVKPILRVVFKIARGSARDGNSADVTVYNLNPKSRAALQGETGIPTEIEAGYTDRRGLIFKGDLDYGSSRHNGTDWVTTLQATDGGTALATSRINVSFDAGAAVTDVIRTAANSLGVGLGNLDKELGAGIPRSTAAQYIKGVVLSGLASDELDKVLKRAGFNWSIQNNQLQLTRQGGVINPGEAIVLNNQTGLIGRPERGEGGIVKTGALLNSELVPGKRIKIQGGDVDGFYRIDQTEFAGDTWGPPWTATIEARPL